MDREVLRTFSANRGAASTREFSCLFPLERLVAIARVEPEESAVDIIYGEARQPGYRQLVRLSLRNASTITPSVCGRLLTRIFHRRQPKMQVWADED